MTWTTDHEFDMTVVTVMDDTGTQEDVMVELGEDYVDIKQYNETFEAYDLIQLTPQMMLEILESFKYPEGIFTSEVSKTELS